MVYSPDTHPTNAGIEALDREGMRLIENKDCEGFQKYLNVRKLALCVRIICALAQRDVFSE
jgi:hypothetical protein